MEPRRVFRSWLCVECMAKNEDAPIKLHRSSRRVLSADGRSMQIGTLAPEPPFLVMGNNSDIYCPRCGFIYEYPPDLGEIANDPHRPEIISGLKSLECNRFRSWRDPRTKKFHTIIALNDNQFWVDGRQYRAPLDQREALAEQTLAAARFARPVSAETSIRSSKLCWQFCPEEKKAFLSYPRIWIDPATARTFYHCPLCAEAGLDEWHLMAQDWRDRGCPTSSQECSQEAQNEYISISTRGKPTSELYDEIEVMDHGVEVDGDGAYFYDPIYAAMRSRRNKGVSADPLEQPQKWESKLPSQPVNDGLPNVSRGSDVILHYCPTSGRSFMARELIWTDKANENRKHFYCVLCDEWHYMKADGLKPKGYLIQAIKTAIVAVSRERQRIGAIPPSMTDIQSYCSGWWPSKKEPFEATNGRFDTREMKFTPASVRDVILALEAKGQIYTLKALLDGSRRVIGGVDIVLARHNVKGGSGNLHTYILRRREIPDAPKIYHDVHYNSNDYEGFRPEIHFPAFEVGCAAPNQPWFCLRARIIELKKRYRPNHPEMWMLDGPGLSCWSPEIIGKEYTLWEGQLVGAVDGFRKKVLSKLHIVR